MTHKERRDLNNKIHKEVLKKLLFDLYGQEDWYYEIEHKFFNIYDYMDERVKGFHSLNLQKKFDIVETSFLITTSSLRTHIREKLVFFGDGSKVDPVKYDWGAGWEEKQTIELNTLPIKL